MRELARLALDWAKTRREYLDLEGTRMHYLDAEARLIAYLIRNQEELEKIVHS